MHELKAKTKAYYDSLSQADIQKDAACGALGEAALANPARIECAALEHPRNAMKPQPKKKQHE
jgi:hypothetical protein